VERRLTRGFGLSAIGLAFLGLAACGGVLTPVSPTALPAISQVPEAPASEGVPGISNVIQGTIEPLDEDTPPCWANLYPCEVFDFATVEEGPIEVALTWDGPPRALMVQLYWAGAGLAHEDVAPLNGPSRIAFVRPRMEAAAYRLRVVSREPADTIPFTLVITY